MKIVDQEVQEVMVVPSSYEDTIKHIEKIGRICYQSEGRIQEGSAEKFVKMLFDKLHHPMIEHSWVVIKVTDPNEMFAIYEDGYYDSPFIKRTSIDGALYIYGNWRAFIDYFGKANDYVFFSKMPHIAVDSGLPNAVVLDTEDIPKEIMAFTAIMKTDRAVTHELVRHRPASYAQESQRYVAYRDEVEFIKPAHYYGALTDNEMEGFIRWEGLMSLIEKHYKSLMKDFGESPQQARAVLPNCTATQIAITADYEEFQHIYKLRTSAAAYPPIRELIKEVGYQILELTFWKDFDSTCESFEGENNE